MSAGASRTAVLVCQGRAAAHGLIAPGEFSDPTAAALLRADERALAEMVRAGEPPDGWAGRMPYELVKATAAVMAARTVEIDRAIRSALTESAAQLVILGAGLDGRAWRMPELAAARIFEVDHPASQHDKRRRAAALGPPPLGHTYVAADLSHDDLGRALADAGHDPVAPSIWIWEGVVPYLGGRDVEASVDAIAAVSGRGSRLIVNYQSPAVSARLGRMLLRALSRSGGSSPLSGEPIRSTWTPAAIARLLVPRGFVVRSDRDLAAVAAELGIPLDSAQARSLPHGRVGVADRV